MQCTCSPTDLASDKIDWSKSSCYHRGWHAEIASRRRDIVQTSERQKLPAGSTAMSAMVPTFQIVEEYPFFDRETRMYCKWQLATSVNLDALKASDVSGVWEVKQRIIPTEDPAHFPVWMPVPVDTYAEFGFDDALVGTEYARVVGSDDMPAFELLGVSDASLALIPWVPSFPDTDALKNELLAKRVQYANLAHALDTTYSRLLCKADKTEWVLQPTTEQFILSESARVAEYNRPELRQSFYADAKTGQPRMKPLEDEPLDKYWSACLCAGLGVETRKFAGGGTVRVRCRGALCTFRATSALEGRARKAGHAATPIIRNLWLQGDLNVGPSAVKATEGFQLAQDLGLPSEDFLALQQQRKQQQRQPRPFMGTFSKSRSGHHKAA